MTAKSQSRKLSVRLPERLYSSLELLAAHTPMTKSSLIEAALAEYLPRRLAAIKEAQALALAHEYASSDQNLEDDLEALVAAEVSYADPFEGHVVQSTEEPARSRPKSKAERELEKIIG